MQPSLAPKRLLYDLLFRLGCRLGLSRDVRGKQRIHAQVDSLRDVAFGEHSVRAGDESAALRYCSRRGGKERFNEAAMIHTFCASCGGDPTKKGG
jgi:hypothetical protein